MITHKSNINEENMQNAFENFKEIETKLEERKTATFALIEGYSFQDNYLNSPYLQKNNKEVKVNFIVRCANNVPNSDTIICNLPSGFRPTRHVVMPIFFGIAGNNGWTYEAVGYGLIEINGNVHVRKSVNTDYKYILINTSYFTN